MTVAADGQAIEAVRQIYGVAGAHDDDGYKHNERQKGQKRKPAMMPGANHQVGPEVFEERTISRVE